MTAFLLFLTALFAQQPQAAGQSQEAAAQASTAQTPATNASPPQERLICRRRVRSGTLAGFENDCRTAADWRALYRGTEQSWRQVQGTYGSTNCRPNC